MTEAEKRERVIRGLKFCVQCRLPKDCDGCPYEGERTYAVPCGHVLMADALALLKEQEPRVMTREEVIHSNDWIWYEWKNTHYGWTVAVNCDGKWIEWEDSTTDQLCEYGKKWRCWTYRPTEEQRKAVLWDGERL